MNANSEYGIEKNLASTNIPDVDGSVEMRPPTPALELAPDTKGDGVSVGSILSDVSQAKVIMSSPETLNTEATTIGTLSKPTHTQSIDKSSSIIYTPHAAVVPVDEDGDLAFEIGVVNDKTSRVGNGSAKVYQQWTRFEQFLSTVETRTPMGTRYLLRKPDSLFPDAEDDEAEILATQTLTDLKAEATDEVTGGSVTPGEKSMPVSPAPANTPVDSASEIDQPVSEKAETKRQHGYEEFFEIRPSKTGGLGAFAVHDIKKDEIILMEKPMLRTTAFLIRQDLAELPIELKEHFMTLAHNPKVDRFAKVEDIWHKNSFEVPTGIAIFAIASRFNHACRPVYNVLYAWDNDKHVMTFSTNRTIKAGEELRITYGGSPISLYIRYGFVCKCGGCVSLTKDQVKQYEAHIWR
ncbi:hypothetical protein QBC44DRAFT_310712 [Cladorrhinum sp. PSN332]|nr:hypothetical protein QBC44DRAFT_310712 [Cladorrhinum sp. PSN332]